VYAINKFRHYITGYSVFVHTDHSTICYIMNKSITHGRVTRWLLLLQEFNISIIDKSGKENVVADFLSRLTNEGEAIPVEDNFLIEHLFTLSTNTPWFADISNYLAASRLPQHLSPKKRQRVIRQSAPYSWIEGYLFHTGQDRIIRCCVREDDMYDILKHVTMNLAEATSQIKGLQTKNCT
jgi:hypothetical protein